MLKNITFAFIISISIFMILIALWVNKIFGDVSVSQMIFALSFPLDSADERIKLSFYKRVFLAFGIFIFIIIAGLVARNFTFLKPKILSFIKYAKAFLISSFYFSLRHKIKLSLGFFALSLGFLNQRLHILEMINYTANKSYSNFYEEYFATPSIANTPKIKRNLILILAESFESTYSAKSAINATMGGGRSSIW